MWHSIACCSRIRVDVCNDNVWQRVEPLWERNEKEKLFTLPLLQQHFAGASLLLLLLLLVKKAFEPPCFAHNRNERELLVCPNVPATTTLEIISLTTYNRYGKHFTSYVLIWGQTTSLTHFHRSWRKVRAPPLTMTLGVIWHPKIQLHKGLTFLLYIEVAFTTDRAGLSVLLRCLPDPLHQLVHLWPRTLKSTPCLGGRGSKHTLKEVTTWYQNQNQNFCASFLQSRRNQNYGEHVDEEVKHEVESDIFLRSWWPNHEKKNSK